MIMTVFFRLFPAFTSPTSHLYSLVFWIRWMFRRCVRSGRIWGRSPPIRGRFPEPVLAVTKVTIKVTIKAAIIKVSIIFIIKSVLVTIEVSISTKLWIATAVLGWNWNQSDLDETKVEQAKTDLGSICFHQSLLLLLPLSFSNFFELDTNYFRFGVFFNFNKHSNFCEFSVFSFLKSEMCKFAVLF